MAKGKKGGRKGNNGRKNNYFQNEIQRGGKAFLTNKNARQLQFDSTRIFRDLARGNIDVRFYEEYFNDPQLLEALIVNSNVLGTKGYIQHLAMSTLMNVNKMNNVFFDEMLYVSIAEEHRKASEAYFIINRHMLAFRQSRDINVLMPMVKQLQNYRYDI